jgi:hypothetical protein
VCNPAAVKAAKELQARSKGYLTSVEGEERERKGGEREGGGGEGERNSDVFFCLSSPSLYMVFDIF